MTYQCFLQIYTKLQYSKNLYVADSTTILPPSASPEFGSQITELNYYSVKLRLEYARSFKLKCNTIYNILLQTHSVKSFQFIAA